MRSPLSVTVFAPSSYTGATGCSPVPGRLMPMLACLLSPGPLTTQPMTATVMSSTPDALLAPLRHAVADVALDLLRELLEIRAGGAAAAGAGDDHRREGAQSHGLENFLRDDHFLGAIAAGLGRQRDADGVADALLQQHAHGRGGGDDALAAHAGLGEPQVQGIARSAPPGCCRRRSDPARRSPWR